MSEHQHEHERQNWTPAERERLEQELLELHFGCHPDPAALQARLLAEPALRELQAEVGQQASVLAEAAQPPTAALSLPGAARPRNALRPGSRTPWWRDPWRRSAAVAAAALLFVGAVAAWWGWSAWQLDAARGERASLTVSAPQAVPAGAPWNFTVQCQDLDGAGAPCELTWRAIAADGTELGTGSASIEGQEAVAIPAGLAAPRRLQIAAEVGGRSVERTLLLQESATAPIVHASTDRPVYRPGETVFVRGVVLDRATLQPSPHGSMVTARILDPKGAPVFHSGAIAVSAQEDPQRATGTGACVWQVPAEAVGGEYTLELHAWSGAFPVERLPFVVRAFTEPRLDKHIVLDRKTYRPGARGSAAVRAERMGGGPAAGAAVRAALVLDGEEVWSRDGTLDAAGAATFAFEVPAQVSRGAARFVAAVTDGGVVETEVEPFVVPTGEVRVAAFPEGGALVAGCANRVYLEVTDPLDRPVDTGGAILDRHGNRVALFRTEHQGRARCTFTPAAGMSYRVAIDGLREPLELPAAHEDGIALSMAGDGVAAGAPLQVQLRGRGRGPWVVGAFARGLLVGQATARPDGQGAIDATVTVPLPASAAGVLRVTVFDRALQPVAERLVRRAPSQRVAIGIDAQHPVLAPGGAQQVSVRTTDETGEPIPAFVGISVTDGAVLALGDEPAVGLMDHGFLFADVEKLEDLGDWFLGAEHGERNVDLLLGTRGWRRFVWRNDEAAQAAIADAGEWGRDQLQREGFAQKPQVASDRHEVESSVAALAAGERDRWGTLGGSAGIAALGLLLWLFGEGLCALRRPARRPWLVALGAAAGATLLLVPWSPSGSGQRAALAEDFAALAAAPGGPVILAEQQPGFLVDGLGRVITQSAVPVEPADPMGGLAPWPLRAQPVSGFDAFGLGVDRDVRARVENLFLPALGEARVALEENEFRMGVRFARPEGRVAFFTASRSPHGTWTGTPAREYAHERTGDGSAGSGRADFTPTVYWHPLLLTDEQGAASVSFDTSDAVTTWRVRADAHGGGRIGQAAADFRTVLPFHLAAKLPVELSAGDRLELPVAVTVAEGLGDGGGAAERVELTFEVDGPLALRGPGRATVELDPAHGGRGRHLVPVLADGGAGTAKLTIAGAAGRHTDEVTRTIPVAPRGFPQRRSWSGAVAAGAPGRLAVSLPAGSAPGSGSLLLRVFPSPLAMLGQGLLGILQEPHGCFEQASSSNYPNVMVLNWLQASGDDVPAVALRARELLPKGYAKITGYECRERGYEWFGGDPGHEALTAYGLLQFHDMQRVHEVDAAMVERTKEWLLGRRDGQGGYLRNGRALDRFGGAPPATTDAYVTYALLHTGVPAAKLGAEIGALAARARTTGDAYELALLACALHDAGHAAAAAARARLADLQEDDGSLRGAASITRSGPDDLAVETTAFAVLAWLPDAAHRDRARQAVEFLQGRQSARGTFGASQATICALRALTAWAQVARGMAAPGSIAVFAGEKKLGERAFAAGQAEPVEFELFEVLPPGEHALRIELQAADGQEPAPGAGDEEPAPLPWACDLSYHADLPADDPDAAVTIATRLLQDRVAEGRTVALEVALVNRTAEGQPMTIAVVGLPAGLEVPTSVLDDRQRASDFDLWELRGRELALYWRSLAPSAEHRVRLDLVAAIPGVSTGPASRAWLYYTPQQKRWATPLRVEVTPAPR